MIAISYRREDSLPVAGRLYDRLQSEFGRNNVFMDFDSIPYGVDFREHIKQIIGQSKVLVAIIGPNWLGRRKHRGRRIDDPSDFVRLEIAYALERKLPIIPILVSNTQMPRSEELPQDIEALAFRNGLSLDVGIDFHHHAERLSAAINRLLSASPPPTEQENAPQISPASEIPRQSSERRSEPITSQPAPIPAQPAPRESTVVPVESTPKPPVREEKVAPPAVVVPSPTEDRQSRRNIDLSAQIDAIRTGVGKVFRGVGNLGSAIKSGINRSFASIQNGGRTVFRSLSERIQRRRKTITISAALVVGLAIAGAAIYWGVRSGTFERLFAQVTQSLKERKFTKVQRAPPPPGVIPRASEAPVATPPSTSATAAQIAGSLVIDSTPRGEAYEVIDSENKHHIGKTPGTVDDLESGYAQVIFKREGMSDHREAVWIASNKRSSITWKFPEVSQQPPAMAPNPSATPTPLVANQSVAPSAAPPSSTWQTSIGDFVRQFVAVNQSQDANATVGFYAPTVDYFGNRGKDHAYILRDVQKYNTQWPARRDSIDGDIRIDEKTPNQQYVANFKLNLYTENSKTTEWSKGEVAMTLDIHVLDGVPKIAAINQKKLQRGQSGRGKGPRPPDMEPPGPIKPTKLTKVFVKKYGFSALLPPEMFPDAETKLADGTTDRLNSLKGCANIAFSAPHENVRKVFDDYVNQFQAAPEHRTIDYKVVKDTWFVVSGSTPTTGYYVKGVRHGDDVFVMELDYMGAVCRIPASMVAQISRAFNGETDALATTNPSPSPDSTPAGSGGEKIEPKLVSIHIRSLNCSVSVPIEIFPNAVKLTNGENRVVSTDGSTSLEFSHIAGSLARHYKRCATEEIVAGQKNRHVQYKLLKDSWFVVSGTDASGMGGFYWKGIRAPTGGVNLMQLNYPENSTPLSDETLTAISRSFTGK